MTTADGLRPISEIAVGDLVLAYDEATHSTGLFTVTDVISHTDPSILQVTIAGEVLETTAGHPFYTWERGWVDAGELRIGEHVHRANDGYGIVQAVVVVGRAQPMYNLTVAQAHTFFAGRGRWLVHNAGGECISWKHSLGNLTAEEWGTLTRGWNVEFDYYTIPGGKYAGLQIPQWTLTAPGGLIQVRIHAPQPPYEGHYVARMGYRVLPETPGALKNPYGDDWWLYVDENGKVTEDLKAMHIPVNAWWPDLQRVFGKGH